MINRLIDEEIELEESGQTPGVLVFASGDEKGGGSGFQELVEFSERARLSLTPKSSE